VRVPARDYYRAESRVTAGKYEPHEKYHIDPADFPADCDCQWMPTTLKGMPITEVERCLASGWVLARACDFPAISGYGQKHLQPLIDSGRIKAIDADAPVERDSQILLVRPREMSDRADAQRLKEAREQVDLQGQRLYSASQRAIGEKRTEFRHGRQYANPDTMPEFQIGSQEV
jgi:hypothetical protein